MTTPSDSNPYQPPAAAVADAAIVTSTLRELPLYVVAPRKFLIMMIGTTGIYAIYWFYRNWTQLKRERGVQCMPVMRCIFSLFFTHSLFARIDAELRESDQAVQFRWAPTALATIYVVAAFFSSVLGRFAGERGAPPILGAISLLLLAPMTYALYRAQCAIDVAVDDPDGSINARLGMGNVAWLAFGALIWLANLLGLYALLVGMSY